MEPTIVVVGVGALGSHFVQCIRNFTHRIEVVDFDTVDLKNCLAQFHGKAGARKLKVLSLKGTMQFLWGRLIHTNTNKLTDKNVAYLLGEASLVVDCLDNAPGRNTIQEYVRAHQIPCLHGGLAGDGQYARVVWDQIFQADDAPPGVPTCENGDHLPFIAMVAALMAVTAQRFLSTGAQSSFAVTPLGIQRL